MHEWTGPTGVHFRDVRQPSGTYYRDTTPERVVYWLEQAREHRYPVRLFLGDSATGRDWLEEHYTRGRVGRSTGTIKVPLLVPEGEHGGPAISCDCIVRLIVKGQEVYRHPKYHQPALTIAEIGPREMCGRVNLRAKGYTHTVNPVGANFKSLEKAQRWVAFMRGERSKP